ncbi:MAG: hypothetical protein ACLPV2_12200 [Steroidobacteraceae bacterium]
MTLASRTADNKAAGAYRREYGIRVAILEEFRAIAVMLEKLDGLIVFARVCDARSEG